MKILVAVPHAGFIEAETMQALFNVDRCGHDVHMELVYGYEIDRSRNAIANIAISGGYDYVWMVDSDVVVPRDALRNLLDPAVDVVYGLYREKRYVDDGEFTCLHKFSNQTINYDEITRLHIDDFAETRMKIKGGGAGCLFINVSVFSRIPKPYFRFHEYPDGGVLSEDLWFSEQLRSMNIPVYADSRVKCQHILKRKFGF